MTDFAWYGVVDDDRVKSSAECPEYQTFIDEGVQFSLFIAVGSLTPEIEFELQHLPPVLSPSTLRPRQGASSYSES